MEMSNGTQRRKGIVSTAREEGRAEGWKEGRKEGGKEGKKEEERVLSKFLKEMSPT